MVSNSLCDSLFHKWFSHARDLEEERRPFLPSLVRRAGNYKRCVEFCHRADGASRRPIFAAYFRTLPSGAKRACTHVYTREKVCTHAPMRLRLAEHAYVRYVRAHSPCSISRVRVWSILRSPSRIASIDTPARKRWEVSVKLSEGNISRLFEQIQFSRKLLF